MVRNLLLSVLVVSSVSMVASETTEAVVAPVTSFVSKASTAVCSLATTPLDWVASVIRTNKLVEKITATTEGQTSNRVVTFIADHKVAANRSLAFVATAAAVFAAYKAYKTFIASEVTDADYDDLLNEENFTA